MEYSEFKEMCCTTWSGNFNYLCFDKTKIKREGKYRISKKAKVQILNVFQKLKLFKVCEKKT